MLLKNSFAVVALRVLAKVDPVKRAQSHANQSGDGLRLPESPLEERVSSFSTVSTRCCLSRQR
jgi:hypothetical protein